MPVGVHEPPHGKAAASGGDPPLARAPFETTTTGLAAVELAQRDLWRYRLDLVQHPLEDDSVSRSLPHLCVLSPSRHLTDTQSYPETSVTNCEPLLRVVNEACLTTGPAILMYCYH